MKVIFDTNIWISFLIGKSLASIKPLLTGGKISLVYSQALLNELREVTQRPGLKKYFKEEAVNELIQFMEIIGESFDPPVIHQICRDKKDNFLLDLIDASRADFLVTGDKDLLEIRQFLSAEIVEPAAFRTIVIEKDS